ncbi:MAG TPA: phosphatase PAP2 family protein [Solirubrobacteraceae bacterium]
MPARPLTRRRGGSGPLSALGVAGSCLVAMALLWVLAELVPALQWRDAQVLHDFTLLSSPRIDGVGTFLLRLLNPLLFILWGIALVAVALARERPRVAVAVAAILALAPWTTETLKPILAHPHVQIGYIHVVAASWPSGHSTAATILVLSALLVTPRRLRPIVAVIGVLFVLAVSVSLLILAWHMPSDVLGGYLVATLWAALAVAALRAADRRWPPRRRA